MKTKCFTPTVVPNCGSIGIQVDWKQIYLRIWMIFWQIDIPHSTPVLTKLTNYFSYHKYHQVHNLLCYIKRVYYYERLYFVIDYMPSWSLSRKLVVDCGCLIFNEELASLLPLFIYIDKWMQNALLTEKNVLDLLFFFNILSLPCLTWHNRYSFENK